MWHLIHSKEMQIYDKRLLILFSALAFLVILIRTAWISDDAAITLRTVLNFTNGFGPTFNIDERVQAYTHPLWFFVLSLGALIFGNVFYSAFFASIVTSAAAFVLLIKKFSRNAIVAFILVAAVILSKAFIDFSTSGLENPLSHLLLLIAVIHASSTIEERRDGLAFFFMACSGIYLNRPDLLVLVFPAAAFLALSSLSRPKKLLFSISLAALPVVAWTAFSLFYYGFPFPNTAYAKLGTGIDFNEKVYQGLAYITHSIGRDPVTVFIIAAGIILGLIGSILSKLMSAGVILYLLYVISIGGDFMEGRFLTAPFFLALIVVAREAPNGLGSLAILAAVLVLGSSTVYSNILSGPAYSNTDIGSNGIADERGFYYQRFGLLAAEENTFLVEEWTVSRRDVEIVCGGLGFGSIAAGPGAHFIDNCALADPLLARLPAEKSPHWRVGHFYRQIPTNYKESIEHDKNLLVDRKTRLFWDSIRLVTRGELFDKDRIAEIVRLNLGLVSKPDWEMYRTADIPRSTTIPMVSQSDVGAARSEGTAWNAPGNVVFDDYVEIELSETIDVKSIDISVDNNDVYELAGLQNDKWISLAKIGPVEADGLALHRITLQEPIMNIKRIRVSASSGDGMYSIGHLLLNIK